MGRRRNAVVVCALMFLVVLLIFYQFGASARRIPAAESNWSGIESQPSNRLDAPIEEIDSISKHGNSVVEIERRSIISELSIEPENPCVGEPVTVTVKNSKQSGSVKTVVNGVMGNPASIEFADAGSHQVIVVVNGWAPVWDSVIRTIDVKKCPDRNFLKIEIVELNDSEDGYLFRALLPRGIPVDSVATVWNFGDDTPSFSSRKPISTHSYAMRNRAGPTSSFVVRARVETLNGKEISGASTIVIPNADWMIRNSGREYSQVTVYDRFPRVEEGHYRVPLKILNIDSSQGIIFDTVEVSGKPCDGGESRTASYRADFLLEREEISAGGMLETSLSIPIGLLGDSICNLSITFRGQTDEGQPTNAWIDLETGIPEYSPLETDLDMVEKISLAMEILGRDRITADDLRRLELEGVL